MAERCRCFHEVRFQTCPHESISQKYHPSSHEHESGRDLRGHNLFQINQEKNITTIFDSKHNEINDIKMHAYARRFVSPASSKWGIKGQDM